MVADNRDLINEVYKNTPLKDIPWNNERPPGLLVELIESGKVKPCKAVDLGCGAGNYITYLAENGFEATGIDMSPAAIEIARKNAQAQNVKCNFIVADIVNEFEKFEQRWDFAYDWGVLHHILPENRPKYVQIVHQILNPQGKYLSVCFSEKDNYFETSGKYRTTSIGSILYFSSEEELRKLFEPNFTIIEIKTLEIEGKFTPHVFNYVFMERK
jgi:SAM-dependent methyltransferase